MVLEKLSAYAVRFCRATSKGTKYVTRETKELLANHTAIGRRLREGVNHAKEAVKIRMKPLADKSTGMIEQAEVRLNEKGVQAVQNLRQDAKFMEDLDKYSRMRGVGPAKEGEKAIKLNDEQFIQLAIETLGVGPTKAAQIISGNPAMMSQIEQKLGSQVAKALKNTKSGCFPTRTVEQAQELITKAFPEQNILVQKQLGVASIGETYLVKRPDGTEAVVKMIKNGVNKEQLVMEEKLLTRMLREFSDSPAEFAKVKGQLRTLYQDWGKELNFADELANNQFLAKGAKRFKVARITDIAKDGSCIVMNKANGIQMNKLMEILKDYKTNPTEFASKYAKEIAENPWLANPEKVAKELPTSLLKAFDEQFMFMKKGGQSIMHGDPHTGNFFITQGKNGKLIPEFIDTGSCVTRTGAQIKEDISFFSNYFVGNSKGVAEYFVKQCPHKGWRTDHLVDKIATDIQSEIFGKTQNIRKFSDVQANLNAILEKHGLQMSAENATAMKAQMQFFSAVSEAGKLTGQSVDIMTLMKDIPQAAFGMAKCGTNPWSSVRDACKFAFHNQKQAVGTAYQFTIKDVDRILKSDGTISTLG